MINYTSSYEKRIRARNRKSKITGYSVGIGVFKKNKLLIIRRTLHDYLGGFFELPGGNTDNDDFETAVRRELFEETGLSVTSITKWFAGFIYQVSYNTIKQCNCLVKTSHYSIRLNHDEHDLYKWIDITEINKYNMTPQMYKCVKTAFKLYENI